MRKSPNRNCKLLGGINLLAHCSEMGKHCFGEAVKQKWQLAPSERATVICAPVETRIRDFTNKTPFVLVSCNGS